MSQKESEWKDEFYRRFQEEYPHLSDEQSEEIKTFVSNILSNREKEIAEEVERLPEMKGNHSEHEAYLIDRADVLSILKH
jgi:oligoendopeptidase F